MTSLLSVNYTTFFYTHSINYSANDDLCYIHKGIVTYFFVSYSFLAHIIYMVNCFCV